MNRTLRLLAGILVSFLIAPVLAESEETGVVREKLVTFVNGEVALAGTLALPEGPGPHPAAPPAAMALSRCGLL